MNEFSLLIGGKLMRGAATLEVINPATEQVIGTAPVGTLADVEAALAAAAASVNPGKKSRTSKPGSSAESGQRKYLGYIVRVYYHDQLQAVRAEPSRLLKLYPPSPTASP